MRIPVATYRLQFCPEFGFDRAREIVDYLAKLGITDIYASPVFAARPASSHGYDGVDPNRLNADLGNPSDFEGLFEELNKHEMGWIQDIVPNHMAFHPTNVRLMDLFEGGRQSESADWFDIDWEHYDPRLKNRILTPFLGRPYAEALEERELVLEYGKTGFCLQYFNLHLPLHQNSYSRLLAGSLDRIESHLGSDPIDSRLSAWLRGHSPPATASERKILKERLWALYRTHSDVKSLMDDILSQLREGKEGRRRRDPMDALLSEQTFHLAHWKSANQLINYRRFFTINEMICLRVEREAVFSGFHQAIIDLCEQGKFTGLRIDHIDGLYDPAGYLKRLRRSIGDRYLVVEKILEQDEDLPTGWPVQGTTGYEFLANLNAIFCDPRQGKTFERIYVRFTGQKLSVQELVERSKRLIIQDYMAGDLDNLGHLFLEALEDSPKGRDLTLNAVRAALTELIAVFPIYRTYTAGEGLQKADLPFLRRALQKAKKNSPPLLRELETIEQVLLSKKRTGADPLEKDKRLQFAMRFQQFTGPLMAKGFEDTMLYIHARLISLNDVGANPAAFGKTPEDWHHFHHARQSRWPHAMSATATHDTKRGEDARARINVLSEIPQEWEARLLKWYALNRGRKPKLGRQRIPLKNEEYFLYQTLIGAFPFGRENWPQLVDRIKDYMIKAQREAKVHTDWNDPNSGYETALKEFISGILLEAPENQFLEDFRTFHRRVAHYGILNSLSQVLVKVTAPGLPDFYQGTEFWDFSLVDPDNRRAVDFELRRALLDEIHGRARDPDPELLSDLWSRREDGRIKLFLTHRALMARKRHRLLFERGNYQAVGSTGRFAENVLAYARREGTLWCITLVPRFLTRIIGEGQCPIGSGVWQDTCLSLPEGSPTRWEEVLSGRQIQGNRLFPVSDALNHFPVGLLVGEGRS